jgi:hypothetical protein
LEGGGTSSGHESGDREGEEASEEEQMLHDSWGRTSSRSRNMSRRLYGLAAGLGPFVPCPSFIFLHFPFYPLSVLCFEVSYKSYGIVLPRLMIA